MVVQDRAGWTATSSYQINTIDKPRAQGSCYSTKSWPKRIDPCNSDSNEKLIHALQIYNGTNPKRKMAQRTDSTRERCQRIPWSGTPRKGLARADRWSSEAEAVCDQNLVNIYKLRSNVDLSLSQSRLYYVSFLSLIHQYFNSSLQFLVHSYISISHISLLSLN
jgi:hypothetical protein